MAVRALQLGLKFRMHPFFTGLLQMGDESIRVTVTGEDAAMLSMRLAPMTVTFCPQLDTVGK
jgi:hypothetical protein